MQFTGSARREFMQFENSGLCSLSEKFIQFATLRQPLLLPGQYLRWVHPTRLIGAGSLRRGQSLGDVGHHKTDSLRAYPLCLVSPHNGATPDPVLLIHGFRVV